MKLKAFILLLCFPVYFIDTIAATNCRVVKMEKKMMCCKHMKTKQPPVQKYPKPKDCSKDCFNCPLFYSGTLPCTISVSADFFGIEKNLDSSTNTNLPTYHSDIWKPPDTI